MWNVGFIVMINLKSLLALFIFAWILASSGYSYKFTKEEINDITLVATIVLNKCPVGTCLVVSIGRSLTPITAYFEIKKYNNSYNLPLSNFRYGEASHETLLSQAKEEVLFKHFDQYLPSAEQSLKKSILFIDFSSSGESISAAKKYLSQYFSEKKRENEIKFFAVAKKTDIKYIINDFNNIEFYPIPKTLSKKLLSSAYDNHSKYGSYDIKKKYPSVKPNKKYFDFLLDLKIALSSY
jgi:hypothetical protein